MNLEMFDITISHPAFDGDVAVVLGQGGFLNEALADAGKILGSAFRPKQDGRQAVLLTVTMRRPDGTQYNATVDQLKAKLARE